MPQGGEINLQEVKAKYNVQDIKLVDSREIDFANEFRLTFEVCFGIGSTALGAVMTNFNWILSILAITFLGYGFWNGYRYKKGYEKIK